MQNDPEIRLCPEQQKVFDWFVQVREAGIGNIFHCSSATGRGRSTVLKQLHRKFGGKFLRIGDFVDAAQYRHPLSMEDALHGIILDAFREHDVVILDDYHLATSVMSNCHFYPRSSFIDSPMAAVAAYVIETGKTLVIGTKGKLSSPLRACCLQFGIGKFTVDGLESESVSRVCVMMTAMDVGNLPPALIRSGRIELWLEMRLPDAAARSAILSELVAVLPNPLNQAKLIEIVAATENFTGADIKRMVDDGKALYAYDRVNGTAIKPVTEYFLAAAQLVQDSKAKYAEAESRANATRPSRPSWFNPFSTTRSSADDE